MKRNSIVVLLALLVIFSCKPSNYWKLKIEMPRESKFDLATYKELVITNFLIKNETKDVDLNKELVDYFASEIGQKFEGKITSKEIILKEKELFENKDFWKNLSNNKEQVLFLSGCAEYTEEVRKAILEKRKDRFEDRVPSKKTLAERKFYTLSLDLYFIDPKTGAVVFLRNYKESKGYENPKQTGPFALFDLIQRVKIKLFRSILEEGKIQERHLISN